MAKSKTPRLPSKGDLSFLDHNNLYSLLQKEILILKQLEAYLIYSIDGAPDDTLNIRFNRRSKRYEYYLYEKGNKRTYLPKSAIPRAYSIVTKDYHKKLLQIVQSRLQRDELAFACHELPLASVFDSLNPGRKALLTPFLLDDEAFTQSWYDEHPGSSNSRSFIHSYTTNRGETVRSKSEKMLADLFDRLGIPYVYECAFLHKDGTVSYPDFLLLNLRLRKTVLFEHFGLMDDPEYVQNFCKKLRVLTEDGLVFGVDFLFSSETASLGIDLEIVTQMLRSAGFDI